MSYLERPVRLLARFFTLLGPIVGGIAETLGLLGLGLGILLQLWQLLFRNIGLLGGLPLWVNDASTLSLVCGAVIYAAASETHLGFRGLATALKRVRLQERIDQVTKPVVAACLVVLVYAGYEYVQQTRQVGGSYSTTFWSPLWLFYLLFPVALLLAALRWLGRRPSAGEHSFGDGEHGAGAGRDDGGTSP